MNKDAEIHSTGDLNTPEKSIDEESDRHPTEEEWLNMKDNNKLAYIHDCLLELYLNMKFQSFEKDKATIDSERVDKELDKLKDTHSL